MGPLMAKMVAECRPMSRVIRISTQIARLPSSTELRSAAEVLKLLADPTRLGLLHALVAGERSVGELADVVGAAPSAVSQHLAKLRLGGLVLTRRDGNRIHYSLVNDHVERLVLEALQQADHLVGGAAHHRIGDSAP